MDTNSKSGRWKWWGLVVGLIGLIGVLVVLGVMKGTGTAGARGGVRIEVTPEISLEQVAILTKAYPEYEEREHTAFGWAYDLVPNALSRRFGWMRRPDPVFRISYGSMDETDARLVMRVVYPESLKAGRKWDLVSRDIEAAIDKEGIKVSRVGYGPGSYTYNGYINKSINNTTTRMTPGGGMVEVASPHVTLDLRGLPVNIPEVTLELLDNSEWDKPKVVRSVKMPNPVYRSVAPLDAKAQALPVTVADKDIEVTLRAVVTRSSKGNVRNERIDGVYRPVLVKGKPVPVSGAIGPEFFPVGNETVGYQTRVVAEVTRLGKPQTEWGVSGVKIAYGKERIPFGISSWGTQMLTSSTMVTFPGDLTLLPSPLVVSLKLVRKDNFPPDESVTVETALPREGEAIEPNVEVKLWDKNFVLKALSYMKQTVPFEPSRGYIKSKGDSFSLFHTGNSMSDVEKVMLVGEGGKSADLSMRQMSASSSDHAVVHNYDLKKNVSYGGRTEDISYGEFTTLSVTFRSPRTRDFSFDFVVTPEVATGAAGGEEE